MFLTKNFPEASKKVLSQQKTQYRKIYEQLPLYWLCSISTPLKNCKKIPKMFTSSFPWKILNTTSKILFGNGLGFTKKINLSKCFTFLTTNMQSWTVFEFPWKHFFCQSFFFVKSSPYTNTGQNSVGDQLICQITNMEKMRITPTQLEFSPINFA